MYIAQSPKQECLELVAEHSRSLYEGNKNPHEEIKGSISKLQNVNSRYKGMYKATFYYAYL